MGVKTDKDFYLKSTGKEFIFNILTFSVTFSLTEIIIAIAIGLFFKSIWGFVITIAVFCTVGMIIVLILSRKPYIKLYTKNTERKDI